MTQPAQIFRLIYASKMTSHTRARLDAELPQILAASLRNNSWRGITGLLVAYRGWFIQALEGEPMAVRAGHRAILSDPRHHDAVILAQGPAALRAFGRWSMATRLLNHQDAAVIGELDRRGPFEPGAYSEAVIMRLLHTVGAAHAATFDAQQTPVQMRKAG